MLEGIPDMGRCRGSVKRDLKTRKSSPANAEAHDFDKELLVFRDRARKARDVADGSGIIKKIGVPHVVFDDGAGGYRCKSSIYVCGSVRNTFGGNRRSKVSTFDACIEHI